MTWETFGAAVGAVGAVVGLVALPVRYVAGLGKRITVVERDQKWLIQSTSKQESMLKATNAKVDTLNTEVAAVKATAESTEGKVDLLLQHTIGKVK